MISGMQAGRGLSNPQRTRAQYTEPRDTVVLFADAVGVQAGGTQANAPPKPDGPVTLGDLFADDEETHFLEQDDTDHSLDRYVEINCGGIRSEVQLKMLYKHQDTLLWELAQPGGELYDKGYTFLDCDPMAFNYILNFYRTDRLQMPGFMNEDTWHLELEYYQIENPEHQLPTDEQVDMEQQEMGKPPNPGYLQTMWLVLEDPTYSKWSAVFAGVSVCAILIGVLSFVTATHPDIRKQTPRTAGGLSMSAWKSLFGVVEVGIVMFFSVELFFRWLCNWRKRKFFLRFPNLVDLVAILPFYMELAPGVVLSSGGTFVRTLRLLRIMRVIGLVLKLSKYSAGARVLGTTLLSCHPELGVLSCLLLIDSILFGSFLFFCENPRVDLEESEFNSIMRSTYVALITITTIGYGDYSPKTTCGEAVACVASLTGIFVLGMPISIIGVKFHGQYSTMMRTLQVQEERIRLRIAADAMAALRGLRVLGKVILGPRFEQGDYITPAMRRRIKRRAEEVFREVDVDESGFIDIVELGRAMKGLGCPLSKESLQGAMEVMDDDRSGQVDVNEFSAFVERLMQGEIPDTMSVSHNAMVGGGVKMTSHAHMSKVY